MSLTNYKNNATKTTDDEEYARLMCSVPGCPNRWSVKIDKPMCSFHQWGPRTQNSTSKIVNTWYNKDDSNDAM